MKVCGTDAWSWYAPLRGVAEKLTETEDYDLFWEGHKAGAETLYCHMEKLANLDQLPDHGFEVMCFPVKVARGWPVGAGRLRLLTASTSPAPPPPCDGTSCLTDEFTDRLLIQ